MPAPIPNRPLCDVPGCGMAAVNATDGTEVDSEDRQALPHVNHCERHSNWPHSKDAEDFAERSSDYKSR